MNPAQTIALYQPTLHAVAMKLLKCKADAEDIVQDTFVKWLNAEHEKIQNTKAYLVRAVTNNCLNHIQALKRKKQEYLDSFQWPDFVERFKDSDLAHIDIEAEVSKAFQILVQKLEPLERAVYILKEAFDFDYKSLQLVLDKKQDHCRQLFCRAKKKLQLEKDRFHSALPDKSKLIESFSKACHLGQAADFVAELRNDIGQAISKKI